MAGERKLGSQYGKPGYQARPFTLDDLKGIAGRQGDSTTKKQRGGIEWKGGQERGEGVPLSFCETCGTPPSAPVLCLLAPKGYLLLHEIIIIG